MYCHTACRRDIVHACKSHGAQQTSLAKFVPGDGENETELLGEYSLSNAFSNASDYVQSRLNAGELKSQYCNQVRSRAIVGEAEGGQDEFPVGPA